MTKYSYRFGSHVAVEDIEATLLLSVWGCESLHGEVQVRMDADHTIDAGKRICVIDASTQVGRDINRLFLGFARREFGPNDFHVEHVQPSEKEVMV